MGKIQRLSPGPVRPHLIVDLGMAVLADRTAFAGHWLENAVRIENPDAVEKKVVPVPDIVFFLDNLTISVSDTLSAPGDQPRRYELSVERYCFRLTVSEAGRSEKMVFQYLGILRRWALLFEGLPEKIENALLANGWIVDPRKQIEYQEA